MDYADKNFVEMVPDKTKLLCYTPKGQELFAYYQKLISPVAMCGKKIGFSDEAEHVGIVRSTYSGNMPNVLSRLAAHTRAVFGVLSSGLAKGHSGNPAASLRIEKIFGAPVLLSGLASLVLGRAELTAIGDHYKVSLERLQRHYRGTPAPVVFFMAGSLPAAALLHLRQYTLFGMIARLGPTHILFQLGWSILSADILSHKSWFHQIMEISEKYMLPDPISIMMNPPSKDSLKTLAKLKVLDWWENKLRSDIALLPSLSMFKAEFMSLSVPHPIWTSAISSNYEVRKATVQARMLGGRYRTCWLRMHWSVYLQCT